MSVILSIDVGVKNFGLYMVDSNSLKPIELKNIDLTPYKPAILIQSMDEIIKNYDVVQVLVEQQMPNNKIAIRIYYHVEMYFSLKYPKADLLRCSAKSKGLCKTYSYKQRKEESVNCALDYLKQYPDVLKKVTNATKKDDMCDAVCQLLFKFNLNH